MEQWDPKSHPRQSHHCWQNKNVSGELSSFLFQGNQVIKVTKLFLALNTMFSRGKENCKVLCQLPLVFPLMGVMFYELSQVRPIRSNRFPIPSRSWVLEPISGLLIADMAAHMAPAHSSCPFSPWSDHSEGWDWADSSGVWTGRGLALYPAEQKGRAGRQGKDTQHTKEAPSSFTVWEQLSQHSVLQLPGRGKKMSLVCSPQIQIQLKNWPWKEIHISQGVNPQKIKVTNCEFSLK